MTRPYYNGPPMRARLGVVKMLEKLDPAGKIALFMFDGWAVKPIADFGSDLEVKALRSPGNDSVVRTVEFSVE